MYWEIFYDPSTAVLVSVASLCILYGCYRSRDFFTSFKDELQLEESSLKMKTAIALPIIGSVMLVLLFFFMNWLVYLLKALLSFSSLSGVSFVVFPYVGAVVRRLDLQRNWEVRWLGNVNVTGLASFGVAVVTVIAWLIKPYWLLTDSLAICLAISALAFVRLPNMKIAAVVLVLFFFYDIFWVFLSKYLFKGKSVMKEVAVSLPTLPMVIIIPRILSGYPSLLGLGDIILPGIFLCYLFNHDRSVGTSFKNGYFLKAWIGYIIGFFCTLLALAIMEEGQPALLYLVPCTLLPTMFFSWRKNELALLWNGIPRAATKKHTIGDDDNLDDDDNSGRRISKTPTDIESATMMVRINDDDGANSEDSVALLTTTTTTKVEQRV